MNFQELDQEYYKSQLSANANTQQNWKTHTLTREVINKLSRFSDDLQINLQESIPILNQIGIFRQLTSIPQAKKMMDEGSFNSLRLQYEAKFIYCLWKLIDEQIIQLQQFKQIICLFLSKTPQELYTALAESYSDNQTLSQLIQVWQTMLNQSDINHVQNSIRSEFPSHQRAQRSNIQPFRQYSSNQMSVNQNQNKKLQNQNWYKNKNQSRVQKIRNKQNPPFINYSKYMRHKKQVQQPEVDYTVQYSTEVPSLTVQKQKQLVTRLYKVDKYQHFKQLKKIQDEQKLTKQLSQCTFQPNVNKKMTKVNKLKQIKKQDAQKKIAGFQTAIKRMKVGQQKNKQLKEKLQFRNSKNWFSLNKKQNLSIKAPKFLNRKKQQELVLFSIQFDIGRNKICLKVRERDNEQTLARNIQAIYSLKEDNYLIIKQIIHNQIQRYIAEKTQIEDEENQQENHQ